MDGAALPCAKFPSSHEIRYWQTTAERRVASVRGALRRTDDLALVVGRRQAAGDASGYDRGRVERERSALSARLAVEEAGLSRARARLAGLLGGGAGSPGWRPAG